MTTSLTILDNQHPLVQMGFEVRHPPITASGYSEYCACHRRYFFKHKMGLKRKSGKLSRALTEGTITHALLRGMAHGLDRNTLRTGAVLLGSNILRGSADVTGVVQQANADTVNRAVETAVAMSEAVWDQLSKANWGPLRANTTIICTETKVKAQLYNGIDIEGTIDLVTENAGVVSLVDYKTISTSPMGRLLGMKFDPQVCHYTTLARAGADGRFNAPSEFGFVCIKKPTIRLKKNETFEQFGKRVVEWYVEKEKENPNDPPIVTGTLPFSEVEYASWKRMLVEIHGKSENDIEDYPKTGAPRECVNMYGRECEFIRLCAMDPQVWPAEIGLNFKQEFRYDEKAEDDDE